MSRLWIIGVACFLTVAGAVSSCDNGTCANGATCKNSVIGGKLVGVDCNCGINTYGFDCDKCYGSVRGGMSFYDSMSGRQVADITTTLVFVSIGTAVLVLLTSFCLWKGFTQRIVYTPGPESQDEQAYPNALSPYPQAVSRHAGGRDGLMLDDTSISFAIFLVGVVLFSVGVFTPKVFQGNTPTWAYHLTSNTDCKRFAGHVHAGILLMILGSYWQISHWYRVVSVVGEVSGTSGKRQKVGPEIFQRLADVILGTDRYGTFKYVMTFVVFSLILARYAHANMHGSRSCCERLLTSDSMDYAYAIIEGILIGIDIVMTIYLGVSHLLRGVNATNAPKSSSDGFDKAVVDVMNATFWGAKAGGLGRMIFSSYFLLRLGVLVLALSMLGLDASAYYQGHNPGKTEPSVKGVVIYFVAILGILFRTAVYYRNVSHYTIDMLQVDERTAQENAHLLQHASGPDCDDFRGHPQWRHKHFVPYYYNPILYPDPRLMVIHNAECRYAHNHRKQALKKTKYGGGCYSPFYD